MALEAGTHLGPYEIVSPLGAGGMGEVYRARDTRLDREVAIKVLPERTAKDADALGRLEREAKAIAALPHPNILAVYDVGTESETSYVVTELLQGETLRERVRRSASPWRKSVEIGTAIADGLAAAHARGIVHRDVKPENIFLTKDGIVKILDFGLARKEKEVSPREQADAPTVSIETKPGAVMGTPTYMSPEQVRGEPADARSDIFAFGCVLYELVTGSRAFAHKTAGEIMAAILKEEPPEISATGKEIPPEFERVIRHCLEKKPEERFQSARDLSFALRAVLSDSGRFGSRVASAVPRSRIARWVAATCLSVAAVLVALVALNVAGWRERLLGGTTGQQIESLAILPFTNMGGDPDTAYLADEIPASIINSLSRLENLRVVPRESVYHFMESGKNRYDLSRELSVAAILTGRISVRGGNLSVSAELVDVANDRQLWGERYSERLSDILTIEAEISRQISEELRLRLTGEEKARLAKQYTANAEAHLAYLQGRYFWNKESEPGLKKAIEYFQQAIEKDPGYALAYTGMADAYMELAWWSFIPAHEGLLRGGEAAKRALEIDDTLAEAHVSMAGIEGWFEWKWDEAGERFRRALELNPRYGFAHHMYAHYLALRGHDDQALAVFEDALNVDPLSPHHMTCLASHYIHMGRYDDAERWARKALEIDPDAAGGYLYLGWAYVKKGMLEEAIEEFQKDDSICEFSRAHALGLAGRKTEALRILNKWLEESKEGFVASAEIAVIYAGLGETDQALDWLEDAYEKRDSGWLSFIHTEPHFESLFGNPRFDDLLGRMRLPPSRPALPLPAKAPAKRLKLAVLPFEGTSSDPDTEYLKGEIPASIIHTLSTLSRLQVIPRSTAFRYKVEDKDTATIGRDLAATAVLTGQINIRGDTLIIRAELVDVATSIQLWDERYNRKLADILTVEEDIAKEISEALRLQLTSEEQARLAKRYTDNAEAYQHYLKGRFWWNKRTEDGMRKAIESFNDAIAVDPDYALAYAGKADAYGILLVFRPSEEVAPKARQAVETALAIDDGLAEAHAASGWIHYVYDWDWEAAEAAFARAIDLSPRYATVHRQYAHLCTLGDHEKAIKHGERARRLDPGSLIVNTCLGHIYSWAGRGDEAIEQLRETTSMSPDFVVAHVYLGEAYLEEHRYGEAIEEFRKVRDLTGFFPYAAGDLGYAYAMSGRSDDARQELGELEARVKRGQYVPATGRARIHAGLGNTAEALEWLTKAVDAREVWIPYLKNQPHFKRLHGDPRFNDLLRRVGLEPAPASAQSKQEP